jgi:hypothetical protein
MSMSKVKKAAVIVVSSMALLLCGGFMLMTCLESTARHELEKYLVGIDVSDGISQREADGIASAYFYGYLGACGGPEEGKLINGEWVVTILEGFGGRRNASPIRINATTGAIHYDHGPSFSGYRSFRLLLLWGLPLRRIWPADD